MSWVLSYGCTSAAGRSTEKLWQGLSAGIDHSCDLEVASWRKGPMDLSTRAYLNTEMNSALSQRDYLKIQMLQAWQEAESRLSEVTKKRLYSSVKLGIIFASTKGFIDDVIWQAETFPQIDTISGLLSDFLQATSLSPSRKTCVSNACASGLASLHLAQYWLQAGIVEDVIVLSADAVGSFVLRGFQSLRVITTDRVRPFSGERSGFYLGEGATAIILSNFSEPEALFLRKVGIDSEGFAVTRPSQSGESIQRAIQSVLPEKSSAPDIILAHGTATQVNDQVEDNTFNTLFFERGLEPLVTSTKWSIGHTLGVSGALDFIVGCEILKRQSVFKIANSKQKDPTFKGDYLTFDQHGSATNLKNFMCTSLGFGGLHAAAWVEKRSL